MFEKRVCAYYFRASAALENKTNHGRERNIRVEFYAFYIFLDVLGLIKRKFLLRIIDRLDEKATAPASRVYHFLARLGGNHLDCQLNNRVGRKKFPPVPALMPIDENLEGFAFYISGGLAQTNVLQSIDNISQRQGLQFDSFIRKKAIVLTFD